MGCRCCWTPSARQGQEEPKERQGREGLQVGLDRDYLLTSKEVVMTYLCLGGHIHNHINRKTKYDSLLHASQSIHHAYEQSCCQIKTRLNYICILTMIVVMHTPLPHILTYPERTPKIQRAKEH